MARKSSANRNGIPNPFNPQDPDWHRVPGPVFKPAPKPPRYTSKLTTAAKVRAGSVGVSSSARQRTHKRGPSNRSR